VRKVLHIDCFSGVSGDMMLGALLDAGVPEELVQDAVGSLGLPGTLRVERVRKGGFAAVKVHVEAPREQKHRHLSHILKILDAGSLSDGARGLARRMFERLAEAEAASHGVSMEKVHFHEVGAVDSIFDFVGIAVGIDWLAPDLVTAAPPPTGSGFVQCEHGRLPVPAPAVANLLQGIPLADCAIEAELTTPTGAAVLACIVDEFTRHPVMTIERTGIGAGSRDLAEQPNILRLFVGTADESAAGRRADFVWRIETNLDDVPAEILGFTVERLGELGALDVFVLPIQMKKNRPGVLLTVLCGEDRRDAIETAIFAETGTLGIRRSRCERTKLDRRSVQVETPWGRLSGKVAWNDSVKVFTPEYEDCARAARAHGRPLREVYEAVRRAYGQSLSADEAP
jgi:uncharacterized protein (TIGR00299 family) protein